MLSSILSFGQNPLYTASIYTKMSLKNSQAVKNLDFVDALRYIINLLKLNILLLFFQIGLYQGSDLQIEVIPETPDKIPKMDWKGVATPGGCALQNGREGV